MMETEEPTVEYHALTYLQYMIKPKLLIQYLLFLKDNDRVHYLFDSFTGTLFEWLDKLPDKSQPLKIVIKSHLMIKKLFTLLLLIGTYSGIDLKFVNSFKGKDEHFLSLYEQQLLPNLSTDKYQDAKLSLAYFKQFLNIQKLKKNSSNINEYKSNWINQKLVHDLYSNNTRQQLRIAFINVIKQSLIISKSEVPKYLKQHLNISSSIKTISKIEQDSKEVHTRKLSKLVNQIPMQYKFPSFLQFTMSDVKINYIESKLANFSELVLQDHFKYKSFIKQLLLESNTSSQKGILYSMLLNFKVIEFSKHISTQVITDVVNELEQLFKELKQTYDIPIKCGISFMRALSYLQNYIPIQYYNTLYKLINSVISSFEKDKNDKSVLLLFMAFFSLKLNDNKNTLNFTKLWKRILEPENESFLKNIYSAHFINSLISFNCLVLCRNKTQEHYGIPFTEIFSSELSKVTNVEIESSQSLLHNQLMELLFRKKTIHQFTRNKKDVKDPIADESTIQISKYFAVSRQTQQFLTSFSNHASQIYTSRINNPSTLCLDPLLFKLFSNILNLNGNSALYLISLQISDEQQNISKLCQLIQSIERSRQPLHLQYLQYCSSQTLKIFLKIAKKNKQQVIVKQIIRILSQPQNYQYFSIVKRSRIHLQKQFNFVKWICKILINK